MKKRLSEAEFQKASKHLAVGAQTLTIARGVLIEGRPQADFVKMFGLTKGAVSQAVSRVWAVHQAKNLPAGYERVSAILPSHRAFIVRKWADDAEKQREQKP